MTIDDCTGVILAGGKSSRFGSNKALADLDGRPLVQYPRRVLDSLFSKNLLVTNTPEEYRFVGWPTAADIFPGTGPLAGIHAALCASDTPLIFVTGCDMPFLDRKLITYLHGLTRGFDAVVPRTGKGLEPLHAFYRRQIVETIAEDLKNGMYSAHKTLSGLNIREIHQEEIVRISGSGLNSFRNINTPDELSGNE